MKPSLTITNDSTHTFQNFLLLRMFTEDPFFNDFYLNPIRFGIFQTANDVPIGFFSKIRNFDPAFYSDFKIKSDDKSCKVNIFVILFKIDFEYIKRHRVLMRIYCN